MANNDSGIFTLKEFYNRGVIKLAPDVLVYIGGSLTTKIIAPVSGENKNLTFSDGITTVSIQNNVDPPGSSSATIEVITPIYGEKSNYWTTYQDANGSLIRAPIFIPMMEVKVFFKGRFLVDMQPKYYPAFWGFIKDVDEQYSGGVYKMTLNCVDILHWWQYSTINVSPTFESNTIAGGGQTLTQWSTIFEQSIPFNIIYKLNGLMGMDAFVTPSWLGQKIGGDSIFPEELTHKLTYSEKGEAGIIPTYWKKRFGQMGSLLKMFGLNGKRVDRYGRQLVEPNSKITRVNNASQIQDAIGSLETASFSRDLNFLQNYEVYADWGNQNKFENSEYKTKLDIATDVKSRIDYEFYQDVDGCFIFKPPFYNLNTKGLLPYTILPSDIINYSVNLDSEGIISVMTITTPMYKNVQDSAHNLGKGFHMDIDLCNKYGIRHGDVAVQWVFDAYIARSLALGQMALINAKATTGSITIPGRPEMRLGYPIYMEHRDTLHYVKGINHSFDYGGSFSTILSLETERKKIFDPKDNFRTPFIDKVFRFKEYYIPPSIKSPNDPPQMSVSDPVALKEMELRKGQGNIISMNQGRYKVSDRDKNALVSEKFVTQTTVPYTDEDGYQLIGCFPYGRNVNAISIVTDDPNLPVLKDVYLTTMARPLYKYESESMGILFFENMEGSVPSYLDTDRSVPQILGKISSYNSNLPPDQASTIQKEMTEKNPDMIKSDRALEKNKDVSAGNVRNITNARPTPEFKQEYNRLGSKLQILNDVNKLPIQPVLKKGKR